MTWKHPLVAASGDLPYTEEEIFIMLRLPRKECE
jgi:hypothetical protein